MSKIIFISDLHLDPSRPEIVELFLKFLNEQAVQAESMYILGDLFELWLSDNDSSNFNQTIINALRDVASQGVNIYVMHGNRDFLLGKKFAKQSGCQLINDPCIIELDGEHVLLMHGDTLCTDDQEYQAYRKKIRHPMMRFMISLIPLWYRRRLADRLRAHSRQRNQLKANNIMDVSQDTVERVMKAHRVKTLIHGHTHRPDIHRLTVNQQPFKRIVLGAWDDPNGISIFEAGCSTLSKLS